MPTIKIDQKTKIDVDLDHEMSTYEQDINEILGLRPVKQLIIEQVVHNLSQNYARENIAPLVGEELKVEGPITREIAVLKAFESQIDGLEMDVTFEEQAKDWLQIDKKLSALSDGILAIVPHRHAEYPYDAISDDVDKALVEAVSEAIKVVIAENPINALSNEIRQALGQMPEPAKQVAVFAKVSTRDDDYGPPPLFLLVTSPKDGGDLETISRDLKASPNLQEAVRKLCETASLSFYYTDANEGLEGDYLQEITQAFIDGGTLDAFSKAIEKKSEPYKQPFYSRLVNDEVHLESLRDALMVSLARLLPKESTSEIREALDDVLNPMAWEMVEEHDTSVPLDMIPEGTTVEVCLVPDRSELDMDDLSLNFCSPHICNGEIVPDEALARFLRLINLSSKDLMAAAASASGQTGVICGSSLSKMPDASKFSEGKQDNDYKRTVEQAQAWKKFSVKADPSRPALVSAYGAMKILENGSGSDTVPFVGMQVDLKTFVKAMAAAQSNSRIQIASGKWGSPVVGIHSFRNGSGHYERVKMPFALDAKLGNWLASSGDRRHGLAAVYGLDPSTLRAEISVTEPAPAAKARASKAAAPAA